MCTLDVNGIKKKKRQKRNPIFKGIREAVNMCVSGRWARETVLTGNRLFFAEVLFDSDWNISALRHVTPQPESLRYNESHLFALSQCLSGLCSPSANLLPHSAVFAAFISHYLLLSIKNCVFYIVSTAWRQGFRRVSPDLVAWEQRDTDGTPNGPERQISNLLQLLKHFSSCHPSAKELEADSLKNKMNNVFLFYWKQLLHSYSTCIYTG